MVIELPQLGLTKIYPLSCVTQTAPFHYAKICATSTNTKKKTTKPKPTKQRSKEKVFSPHTESTVGDQRVIFFFSRFKSWGKTFFFFRFVSARLLLLLLLGLLHFGQLGQLHTKGATGQKKVQIRTSLLSKKKKKRGL